MALVAPSEYHMVAHNHQQLQLQGSNPSLLSSVGMGHM